MTEQQQRELTEGLRALADTTRDARAGQQVEAAVLAEMAAHAARESTSHAARESTSHAARESTSHAARESTSHVAREGTSHAARESTSHAAREGTSHAAREGTSHAAREGTSHAAREGTSHAAREGTSHAARESTSHVARRTFLPLAAALILAVGTGVWFARIAPLREPIHPAGFVALPGAAWLPEMESATIVRVSLPVAALPAYGVAIQPDAISGAVLAELLVAQDGQPRAIRFVNDSD